MRNIIYLIISFFTILVISSCEKISEAELIPDNQQRAFMGEVTSTTCGVCGGIGSENFNLIKKNNSGKIIALAFHCNYPLDSMQSPLFNSYENSRPTGGGIPSFHIGDKSTPPNGMQAYVDSILMKSPEAQIKFSNVIEGDSMKITSKIKFFKNVTGDYYVSFYLCEHDIDGGSTAGVGYKQTSGGADYKHNNVVRAGNAANNAYGEKITALESTPANTIYNYNCGIYINPRWNKSKLYVSAVIWKKTTIPIAYCQYSFVNGWDTQVYN